MKAHQYFLLAISFLLLAGCDKVEGKLPKTKQVDEQAANTSTSDLALKKEFLAATRKELDRLQQDLDALKDKMEKVSQAEKEKMKSEIERFQQQQIVLEKKWESFRQEGSNAWKSLEQSFKKSIEDLRNAIRKITP